MDPILTAVVALVAAAVGAGLSATLFASRQRRAFDDAKRAIETQLKAEHAAAVTQAQSAAHALCVRP